MGSGGERHEADTRYFRTQRRRATRDNNDGNGVKLSLRAPGTTLGARLPVGAPPGNGKSPTGCGLLLEWGYTADVMVRTIETLHDAAHRVLSPRAREFVKFGLVGTVGFAIDFSAYGILTRLLGWDTVFCLGTGGTSETLGLAEIRACESPRYPLVAANMVSVFLAVTSNFFLNKFWTFRDPRTAVLALQGAEYFTMSVISWALNQFLTGLFASRITSLHTLFGSSADLAAKVLAIAVVLFFNFGGSKFVIFRRAPGRHLDLPR